MLNYAKMFVFFSEFTKPGLFQARIFFFMLMVCFAFFEKKHEKIRAWKSPGLVNSLKKTQTF